jgi:peptide/nickel transport system substrate-binding protein
LIDPAVAWSREEWYIINAAYNGLVAYRQVPGAAGSLLVPNLAEAIPTPGDGGTTYAFRVREGIRYSDGTAVGPADVRHAIERGFEVAASADEAPASFFYGGIVGADDCTDAIGTDADCDLAEGIEVDEEQRTVTFHLVEADPDFP